MANRQADLSIGGTIGGRLREAREQRGQNQRNFAAIGGVSLGSQNRYEQGEGLPPLDYLLKLGDDGVDWHWIVTGERSPDSLLPIDNDLLEAAVVLPASFKRVLLRHARDLVALASGQDPAEAPTALPPEYGLAQMFEVLLAGIDPDAPPAERAQLLAERLPIGLEQLQASHPVPAKGRRRSQPAAAPTREPQPQS